MRDVSADLQTFEPRRAGTWNVFSSAQVTTSVDALAAMHAKFYCDEVLDEPELSLCRAHQMYAWLRPPRWAYWGSWHGPHSTDVSLETIIQLLLRVKAQAYLFEAANVRHEHEYHLWDTVKLPEGKILVPG
ncbi:MAG TPA: hypothetical protein VGJ60_25975, partial [Chloroflexota bacterium]